MPANAPSTTTAPGSTPGYPPPPPGWPASPYGYAPPPGMAGVPPDYPPLMIYRPLPSLVPRRTRVWLIVSVAVAAVVVLCAAAAGGLYVLRTRLLAAQSAPTGVPSNLQPVATAATTPAAITLLPGWHIVYHDALTTASDLWPNDTHCFFAADGYHINGSYLCYPVLRAAANVDVVVQVAQYSGDANAYGVALRYTRGVGYDVFAITRAGYWGFFACNDATSTCSAVDRFALNGALQEGLDTLNSLEVRANGSYFDFFINGAKVGQATDST